MQLTTPTYKDRAVAAFWVLITTGALYVKYDKSYIIAAGILLLAAYYVMGIIFKGTTTFDHAGEGVAVSSIRFSNGRKEYRYNGLKNADTLLIVEDIRPFLIFEDGYEMPLPRGCNLNELIKWFKDNFGVELKVKIV